MHFQTQSYCWKLKHLRLYYSSQSVCLFFAKKKKLNKWENYVLSFQLFLFLPRFYEVHCVHFNQSKCKFDAWKAMLSFIAQPKVKLSISLLNFLRIDHFFGIYWPSEYLGVQFLDLVAYDREYWTMLTMQGSFKTNIVAYLMLVSLCKGKLETDDL